MSNSTSTSIRDMAIEFFSEDTQFNLPANSYHRLWIESVIKLHGFTAGEINLIYCSDDYLLKMNTETLNHDFFTDILTFDNSTSDKEISGDLFISIDRVKENAESLHAKFDDELDRVMIHGILHLCGYDDKDEKQKEEIRKREDECLSLRAN